MPVRDFEAILSASPPTGVTVSSQSEASAVHRERILLVADEDAEYRAQVRRTFSDRFEVREAVSCEDTLRVLGSSWSEVAAVILSMTLPESGSLRILDAVQKEREDGRFRSLRRGRWNWSSMQ